MGAKSPERLRDINPPDTWAQHEAEWRWIKKHWYIYTLVFALGILLPYLVWG